MINIKLGGILLSVLLITACGNPDQQQGANNNVETQLVRETDSLSNELSTASDSVEKKMNDLQETLESLDN
ncbi:hypothetical protein [Fodinibius sp. Rm-B-1B1-1]|uniref:hypothetical protein n=1 Tax=Fodinibius alkaliphilus TaxID=3140241 RepID=UPI00315A3D41